VIELSRIVRLTTPDIRKIAEDLDFGLSLFFSVLVVQNDVGIVGQCGTRRQNSSDKHYATQCARYRRLVACTRHLVTAILLAVTIIGVPFAWAHLKLAGLALWPIGKMIVPA